MVYERCVFSLSVFFKPRALLRVNARKRLFFVSDSVSGRVCGPSAFTCARACTFYNSVFIVGDLDDDDLQKTTKIEKKISNKKTQERREEKKRRKKNTRERNKKKSNEVGLYLIKNTSSLSLSCVTRNDARRARPPRTKKTR